MQNRKVLIKTGAIVTVVSTNGGWTEIKDAEGKPAKVRNGGLRELTEFEKAATGGKTPAKKADMKKSDQGPAAAKPAQPAAPKKLARGVVDAQPESDDVLNGDGSAPADKLVRPDYDRYIKHDTRSPSGRKALDIGDEAAAILRGQHIDDCYFIVAKNLAKADGVADDEAGVNIAEIEKELKDKYAHLNIGMQRMNLGNRLRKALGTYGNLNAHKNKRSTDEGGPNEGVAAIELIKGTRRKLKRATDPKTPPAKDTTPAV
jgi:hypothetical protein